MILLIVRLARFACCGQEARSDPSGAALVGGIVFGTAIRALSTAVGAGCGTGVMTAMCGRAVAEVGTVMLEAAFVEGPVSMTGGLLATGATAGVASRGLSLIDMEAKLTGMAVHADCNAACKTVMGSLLADVNAMKAVVDQPGNASKLDLSKLSSSQTITLSEMSHLGIGSSLRNDGKLAELLTAMALKEANPNLEFRAIQNASGNGVDLVAIDMVNKTIVHVEVKSSVLGEFRPVNDLASRFDKWIAEAATGKIAGKDVGDAGTKLATDIRDLIANQSFTISHSVAQVAIPRVNQSGIPTIKLRPWPF